MKRRRIEIETNWVFCTHRRYYFLGPTFPKLEESHLHIPPLNHLPLPKGIPPRPRPVVQNPVLGSALIASPLQLASLLIFSALLFFFPSSIGWMTMDPFTGSPLALEILSWLVTPPLLTTFSATMGLTLKGLFLMSPSSCLGRVSRLQKALFGR